MAEKRPPAIPRGSKGKKGPPPMGGKAKGPPPMDKIVSSPPSVRQPGDSDPVKRSVALLKTAGVEAAKVKAGDASAAPEAIRQYTEGLVCALPLQNSLSAANHTCTRVTERPARSRGTAQQSSLLCQSSFIRLTRRVLTEQKLLQEAVDSGNYNEKVCESLKKKVKGVRKRIKELGGAVPPDSPQKPPAPKTVNFKEEAASPPPSTASAGLSEEEMAAEVSTWAGQTAKALKASPVHSGIELTGARLAVCTKGDVYTVVEAGHHKGKLALCVAIGLHFTGLPACLSDIQRLPHCWRVQSVGRACGMGSGQGQVRHSSFQAGVKASAGTRARAPASTSSGTGSATDGSSAGGRGSEKQTGRVVCGTGCCTDRAGAGSSSGGEAGASEGGGEAGAREGGGGGSGGSGSSKSHVSSCCGRGPSSSSSAHDSTRPCAVRLAPGCGRP